MSTTPSVTTEERVPAFASVVPQGPRVRELNPPPPPPTCRELVVGIVAYSPVSPLARNLLTGVVTEAQKDWRATSRRYSAKNLTHEELSQQKFRD